MHPYLVFFFFFNDTATTEIYTLSLHDALPIYLLPNLLTTGCLFSGFYAVVAAIDKHFDHAGLAVFVAMVFDTLDGRIARLTRTESFFGKEYDSLADMVAFGLARSEERRVGKECRSRW